MDLKSFREDKLKLTQAQFAELLEIEQSQISRWENNPDSIRYDVIQKILAKTGAKFEELTGWRKPVPKALELDNSWHKADFTKHTLVDYIRTALEKVDIPEVQRSAYIDDLRSGIETILKKPQISIVGRSDTGKSTMINALLGADKIPAEWTPTTSIAVYIKHISDKPDFIKKEGVDVWVLKGHVNDEDLWDVSRLNDEAYCRLWKVAAGGVEILRSYGTRQGENSAENVGAAVVFIDAPILNNCDIVDLPGFGTELESDDNITFRVTQRAGIIIYLSQANGFMRIEDITYLKRNISELPIWEKKNSNNLRPLSNLFVVASQAHTISNGNREKLNYILDSGCNNLLKTLPDAYWNNRQNASGYISQEYGKNVLQSRFFTYTTDIPDLCARFNSELKAVLEALPLIIDSQAKAFVAGYVKARKPNLVNELGKYEGIVANCDKYRSLIKEIDKSELARVQDNDKRKIEIRAEIEKLKGESLHEFSDYCSSMVNTDNLAKLLQERKAENKKEDIEQFGSWLQSTLQEHCESILTNKSELLSQKIKDFINAYSESVSRPFVSKAMNADFDAGLAFVSVLGKLGIIGGVGASFASATAFVIGNYAIISAILGGAQFFARPMFAFPPLVVAGILISVLSAISLIVIRTAGIVEKSIAKKIVTAFEKNDVAGKYRVGIREFWEHTQTAFDQAVKGLDEEWTSYVNNLRDTVESYDINEIQRKIAVLKCLADFFDNIPL